VDQKDDISATELSEPVVAGTSTYVSDLPTNQDLEPATNFWCHNFSVKKVLKSALALFVVLTVLLTLLVTYSLHSPYTAWYSRVGNARLTVDGKDARGSLHRGNRGETFFVTRRDKSKTESYSISVLPSGQGFVSNCANWTAPRLPVFPIGDVNPPCWTVSNGDRNLVVGTKSLQFTADDGSRITASW